MTDIETLPAKELVEKWIETDNELEERRFGEEIKRRMDGEEGKKGDGEPLHEIKDMHYRLYNAPTGTVDYDFPMMKRIHDKTKKLLGEEAVDIVRRFDGGSPPELLDRLDRARKLNTKGVTLFPGSARMQKPQKDTRIQRQVAFLR